jgi:hypothetical protein
MNELIYCNGHGVAYVQGTLHVPALLIPITREEVSVVWKEVFSRRPTSRVVQQPKQASTPKEHNLSAGAGPNIGLSISRAAICCDLICVVPRSYLCSPSASLSDLYKPITDELAVKR